MYELGPLEGIQFGKRLLKEVSPDIAWQLYEDAADANNLMHDQVSWAWETGARVYVDQNSVVIYGLELSDSEVFKMKLEGKIAQGIVE